MKVNKEIRTYIYKANKEQANQVIVSKTALRSVKEIRDYTYNPTPPGMPVVELPPSMELELWLVKNYFIPAIRKKPKQEPTQ